MIPRGPLDISWPDLAYGACAALRSGDRDAAKAEVLERFGDDPDTGMVCLSVRTGFDLLLDRLALPEGSEVLMSAVTIRDMVSIVREHGLVPVPVDLDPATLAVEPEALRAAVSPRTRAVVVAHLFGSWSPLDPVMEVAREHGLLVIEDLAQSYVFDRHRGHPGADARLFSFGALKTVTALGGAVVQLRDPDLLARMRAAYAARPLQTGPEFLKRVLRYGFFRALGYRTTFGAFVKLCRLAGTTHEAFIARTSGSFAGDGLFAKVRRRPSYGQLALLARRLRTADPGLLRRRTAAARVVAGRMPDVERPGSEAPYHTHWVFPVLVSDPDALMRHLWSRGFDATRGGSSLCLVEPPPERPDLKPARACRMMERILFLPVSRWVPVADLERLGEEVSGWVADASRMDAAGERAAGRPVGV